MSWLLHRDYVIVLLVVLSRHGVDPWLVIFALTQPAPAFLQFQSPTSVYEAVVTEQIELNTECNSWIKYRMYGKKIISTKSGASTAQGAWANKKKRLSKVCTNYRSRGSSLRMPTELSKQSWLSCAVSQHNYRVMPRYTILLPPKFIWSSSKKFQLC